MEGIYTDINIYITVICTVINIIVTIGSIAWTFHMSQGFEGISDYIANYFDGSSSEFVMFVRKALISVFCFI